MGDVANRFDNLRVPVTANLRKNGNTPYYGANGIQDFVDGYTHDGEYILVAEDGANNLKNYPINYVSGRIWVNNHAHVLQAIPDLANTRFLGYEIGRSNIVSLLVGGGRAKLNADALMNMSINLPKMQEQELIAKIFKTIDHAITLHEEKKCQLERLKSALLQKMFADKSGYPTVRFVGFENAWEQCKLGDVFVESTEKSKDDNEELLSVTLKDGVIKAKSLDRKNNASFDKKNYKLVIPNDIAYNSMRMWQGALGVSKYRGIVSPAYTVIKLRNQLENPYFYQYYFKKSETLNLFRKNSQGLTSDTWNLKYPLFSRIHFFTTSIEEQQKISSLLNLLDRTITLHDHKLELLKRMKQSLLQKMFI